MRKQTEFDFVTAMSIIAEVENTERKGNQKFLILALGDETFKTMHSCGYLRTGFTFYNGKIVDTYGTTRKYEAWGDLIDCIKPQFNIQNT